MMTTETTNLAPGTRVVGVTWNGTCIEGTLTGQILTTAGWSLLPPITFLASPHVVKALADLMQRIDRFREVNDTIPLGAAFPVADMLRAADALAVAITRRRT